MQATFLQCNSSELTTGLKCIYKYKACLTEVAQWSALFPSYLKVLSLNLAEINPCHLKVQSLKLVVVNFCHLKVLISRLLFCSLQRASASQRSPQQKASQYVTRQASFDSERRNIHRGDSLRRRRRRRTSRETLQRRSRHRRSDRRRADDISSPGSRTFTLVSVPILKKSNNGAVVVAKLVEQSLSIPEVRSSNPIVGKNLYCTFTVNCQLKRQNKEKQAKKGPFLNKKR